MQNKSFIIVFILCLALLAGCGTARSKEPSEQVALPNPVTVYATAQEQAQAMSIGLEAPEGAADVRYQSIDDIAETVFTFDGVEYSYRAQLTGELAAFDMSGLYYDFGEPVKGLVANREAEAFVCDKAVYICWLDIAPGINYNLSCASGVSAEQMFRMAEAVFVPVQGNVG